jgi:hypothetical protein
MVAVADTEDGIAAVCNLAKRPRSIYLLYYLPPKNYGCRPQRGGGLWRTSPPPKYATDWYAGKILTVWPENAMPGSRDAEV